jgi:4-hydroxybenzoate polyprenyltransferase
MGDIGKTASDIPARSWIDTWVPAAVQPYLRLARLDRPIGIWLLLFPCWWSLALAVPGALPDLRLLVLFAIGAVLMRAAGCTLNDIADRDFDTRVARTATRPIASGAIGVTRAAVFMCGLCLAALVVLLQFNGFAILLGASSLLLVAVYPFAKRVTDWPQAVLGLTFNWGALLGWAAVHGSLDWPAAALYVGGVLWTLGYDTVYAHQDKADDAIVGVRSTALRLGAMTGPWLWGLYGGALALFVAAGVLVGLGWPFYLGAALVGAHFARQIIRLDLDDPRQCLATFRSNRSVGWLLFAAIVLGQVAR